MSTFSFSLKQGINNTNNPSLDGVFCYGWKDSITNIFNLFDSYKYEDGSPYTGLPFDTSQPLVWRDSVNSFPNLGFENLTPNAQISPQPFPTFGIYAHPAYVDPFNVIIPNPRKDVVVRLKVPFTLSGVFTTTIQRATPACGDEVGYTIQKNGVNIAPRVSIIPNAAPVTTTNNDTFNANDLLDFIIDPGTNFDMACDDTAFEVILDLSYTEIPTPIILTNPINCSTTQIDGKVLFIATGTTANLYNGATLITSVPVVINNYTGNFSFTGLNLTGFSAGHNLSVVLSKIGDTDSTPVVITLEAGGCAVSVINGNTFTTFENTPLINANPAINNTIICGCIATVSAMANIIQCFN